MNGIIYCRVSSKEQIEGTSLESQELACREYARARNITILKTFVERGESAKFADRTQLLDLIEFCRTNRGKVQVLLVWKIDRFARNVGDHFNIKAMLLKYDVRIVSVTEPIDANAEGRLMETILAGFAQFDNDVRAMRSVQGMRRKLQEGIFPWKPPLGYVGANVRGEKKTRPDQPDQPLFDLLKKAWKEFATGAYTKAEIGRLMTTWGILAPNGKPFSPQSLDNLFKNPFYAGILVDPWSGEEHQGQHVPMVTPEEFAKVQQIIRRRNRSLPHHKIRPEFPLRGVVRCSQCLRYMTGSFTRGRSRRYPYYHCHHRACAQRTKSYSVQDITDAFHDFLDRITPKLELFEKLKQMVIDAATRRQTHLQAKRTRVQKELDRSNRQLQELIRMRSQQLISDEEFLTQRADLLERRSRLLVNKASGEIQPDQVRVHLDEIVDPLTHLRETWEALPDPQRRRFQQLLLPAGFVNEKIGTAELGLLFRLFGQFAGGNSTWVPPTGESWNRIVREIIEFAGIVRSRTLAGRPSLRAVPTNSTDRTPREKLEPLYG